MSITGTLLRSTRAIFNPLLNSNSFTAGNLIIGGVPKGAVIEIYGPESSGKTTLTMHIIAEAQKVDGKCVIIDAEHAFDSAYATKLGIDINTLLISQPDYGEQALEIADRLIIQNV